jgi:hypothetical protein
MAEQRADRIVEQVGIGVRRRGLIAGAAALVAGIVAKRVSEPVGATSGTGPDGPLVMGSNFANTPNRATSLTVFTTAAGTAFGYPALFGVDAAIGGATNTDLDGLYGTGKGTGVGVIGLTEQTPTGSGLNATGNAAVYGLATNGRTGVVGQSNGTNGQGVRGIIQTGTTAAGTIGVYGANLALAQNSHGIVGLAQNGHGLVGTATNSNPVYAGLVGQGSGGASAGNFFGNVAVTGNLFVGGNQTVAGAKSAALAHPDGSHRLVYCVEAPESWLEDFGGGTLSGGKADVKLDADFAAVADMSDYHVFITTYADSNGHYVANRNGTGFTVMERNKGTGGGQFSWRVVARRKDVKAARLAKFDVPKLTPPTIPPPPAVPVAQPSTKGPDRP